MLFKKFFESSGDFSFQFSSRLQREIYFFQFPSHIKLIGRFCEGTFHTDGQTCHSCDAQCSRKIKRFSGEIDGALAGKFQFR